LTTVFVDIQSSSVVSLSVVKTEAWSDAQRWLISAKTSATLRRLRAELLLLPVLGPADAIDSEYKQNRNSRSVNKVKKSIL